MIWILGTILACTVLLCWTLKTEAVHHARLNAKLIQRLEDLTAQQRQDVHAWLAEHDDESHYP